MMTKKSKTNEELISEMMNFSNYGALSQIFIMIAVQDYADRVIKAGPDACNMGDFISGEAWVGVAKEIKEKLKDRA